jgi:hypothetical protein
VDEILTPEVEGPRRFRRNPRVFALFLLAAVGGGLGAVAVPLLGLTVGGTDLTTAIVWVGLCYLTLFGWWASFDYMRDMRVETPRAP